MEPLEYERPPVPRNAKVLRWIAPIIYVIATYIGLFGSADALHSIGVSLTTPNLGLCLLSAMILGLTVALFRRSLSAGKLCILSFAVGLFAWSPAVLLLTVMRR